MPSTTFSAVNLGDILITSAPFITGLSIKNIVKNPEEDVKKFYYALEQTADSVFITNKEGLIEYVNPAFEQTTGYSKKEVIGKTPRIVKSGIHQVEDYKKLWSTILSGKTYRKTVVNRKKNGEIFYADHTITPIKNEQGLITNFVGIWKDITAQVELEKRQEEFVAIASHELKNPLTIIKSYAQLLKRYLPESKDKIYLSFINKIEFQSEKLVKLVDDLLDANKVQSAKMRLNKRRFDLKKLVQDLVADFQLSNPTYKFLITGEPNYKVVGDKERIAQVITNLLSNAVKYSANNSKVNIKLKKLKDEVVVSIKDRGMGIDLKKQGQVFERYFRVNKSGKNKVSGYGLGLYIAAEIIRLHGGKIWLSSKKGEGSTFSFSLPFKGSV